MNDISDVQASQRQGGFLACDAAAMVIGQDIKRKEPPRLCCERIEELQFRSDRIGLVRPLLERLSCTSGHFDSFTIPPKRLQY
jgi:hypothetical protein